MRNTKKLISVFLVLIMLLTAVPLQGGGGNALFVTKAEAATISSYKVGDILEFGWYPQSKVDDTDLIAELNALGGDNSTWTSYGYYSGTGSSYDGQMTAGDWMRYTDVIYGSNKYRGVIIDSYRPYWTGYTSSYTYQDDNGYYTGTVYWFLYEPIKWRVLDPTTGLVLSETILDSQAYNNYILSSGKDEYDLTAYWGNTGETYYSNNYAESSIRQWLNNDFYKIAFSSAQQDIIEFTALDNSAYSTSKSAYNSEATYDKIYLLSYSDAVNENYDFSTSYAGSDTARQAQGSDYAKSQGLWVYSGGTYGGNSDWRLRSAGILSSGACRVGSDGSVDFHCGTELTICGVRPALNFNPESGIFQSDVKDIGTASAVGTGEVSVYERKNSFTLTAKQSDYNEKRFELHGVSVQVGANSVEHIEGEEAKFEITRAAITDVSRPPIVLTKDGFKDYIIPNTVANSIKDGETLEAYMCLMSHEAKESGAYISTVFAKSTSGVNYRDLVKSSLTAEKDCKYDIYISAVGLGTDVTYYISQDSSHKIESSSGIFLSTDLYSELTTKKDVYVWAVDGSGKITERVKIKLSKSTDDGSLKKMLSMSQYSLGGSGGITIKIPDENPIFGNSEVSLNAFTAPITVYYDATDGTYIGTLGFDLYSYTKQDKTVINNSGSLTSFGDGETKKAFQNFKESFGYFNNKPFASKDKQGKSYKEQWNSFVKQWQTASSYQKKLSDTSFSTDFLGYLEFAVTEQGFVIKEANIKVGADFSYSYTYQGALWVIPAYFKTTLGASASLEGSAKRTTVDKAVPFEFDITLDIEPSVALEAGIGVEKLVKAGVEVKGTAPIKVEFINQHFTFGFHGEINLNTKAFVFSWKKKIAEGDVNVVDTYWDYPWQTNSVSLFSTSLGVPQYVAEEDEDKTDELIEYYNSSTDISERDYLDNMSEWYGEALSKSKISATSDINIDILQESVFEDGKPVCVTVGDKILMAWIEDCSTRDSYNRMRLVYSIYDGENWSSPTAVLDDGKNDDAPVLATDGKNVYFAWQKINEVLDENSQATDALQKVDICTATYSFETNEISETEIISCSGYDYSQAITVENGSPVVYFASCEDSSVATSYNHKINKYSNGSIETLVSSLSYIQSIKADGSDMSYVIDTDGDLSTSNDINVFSYSNGMSDEYDKQDIEAALVGSYYGFIGTQKVMFVTDGTNIYYDLDGERYSVFDNSRSISSLNIVTQDGNPAFVWTQDNGDNSGNSIYYVFYDGEKWTSPVEIYRAEEYYFDALDIVNYKSSLLGVFMQAVVEYEDESEMYSISQSNLGFITITDYYDISVGCVSADEEEFVSGQTAQLCVFVENKGTKTVNSVEFTITDTLSGTNTQTQTIDIDLAPGESENVYLNYSVPSNFATTTLTVTANVDNDVNSENDSAQTKVGLSHISLAGYNLVEDGDYYVVTASVENKSLTEAEDITAKLYINEDEGTLYQEAKIESLSSSQIGYVTFYVEKSSVIFDEQKTAKLFCCFESESSKYGKTATECILITQSDSECGHPLTESRGVIAPSLTQTGNKAGEYCLCCDKYISGGEEIAKHTHTPETDYTVIKKATCTSDGYKAILCSGCKEELSTATITKRSHKLADTTQAKAATCTAEGVMNQKCACTETAEYKACSYTTTRTVSALGHDKIKHSAKAATCTEKGWTVYETCSRCNYSTYKEIAALGHSYSTEWTIDKAPSVTSDGSKSHHCTRCDSKTDVTSISATIDYSLGDVDGDGNITAADARYALRASVGLESCEEGTKEFLAADANKDGTITAADARLILRASVGLENLPLN